MIKVETEVNSRLDSYLSEQLELSRSKVQKLIKENLVTVNGKNVNGSYQVKLNDEIEVNDDLNYEINVEPENIDIDIVYEDEDLLMNNIANAVYEYTYENHRDYLSPNYINSISGDNYIKIMFLFAQKRMNRIAEN